MMNVLYSLTFQMNYLEINLGKFERHVFTSNNTVVKQKVEIARYVYCIQKSENTAAGGNVITEYTML